MNLFHYPFDYNTNEESSKYQERFTNKSQSSMNNSHFKEKKSYDQYYLRGRQQTPESFKFGNKSKNILSILNKNPKKSTLSNRS